MTTVFTDDDYQLLAEATYREEDRRELFERCNGIPAPADDHLDRLADLARRISAHVHGHPHTASSDETATDDANESTRE